MADKPSSISFSATFHLTPRHPCLPARSPSCHFSLRLQSRRIFLRLKLALNRFGGLNVSTLFRFHRIPPALDLPRQPSLLLDSAADHASSSTDPKPFHRPFARWKARFARARAFLRKIKLPFLVRKPSLSSYFVKRKRKESTFANAVGIATIILLILQYVSAWIIPLPAFLRIAGASFFKFVVRFLHRKCMSSDSCSSWQARLKVASLFQICQSTFKCFFSVGKLATAIIAIVLINLILVGPLNIYVEKFFQICDTLLSGRFTGEL